MGSIKGLVISVMLVFTLAVYLIVAGPVVDGVADVTQDAATHPEEVTDQQSFIEDVALLYIPLLLGFTAVIFAYASVVSREGYRGRAR